MDERRLRPIGCLSLGMGEESEPMAATMPGRCRRLKPKSTGWSWARCRPGFPGRSLCKTAWTGTIRPWNWLSPTEERRSPTEERRSPTAERRSPTEERRSPTEARRSPVEERRSPHGTDGPQLRNDVPRMRTDVSRLRSLVPHMPIDVPDMPHCFSRPRNDVPHAPTNVQHPSSQRSRNSQPPCIKAKRRPRTRHRRRFERGDRSRTRRWSWGVAA